MKNIKWTITLILIFTSGVAWSDVTQEETLKGIKGIHVVIENPVSLKEETGLDEDQLRTDVELKLRMAGIKVLSLAESFFESGSPFLCVTVATVTDSKVGGKIYGGMVVLSLKQSVKLSRNPNIEKYHAKTWEEIHVVLVSKGNLEKFVRDIVKDKVDEFLNDYLKVNPRQVSTPEKK